MNMLIATGRRVISDRNPPCAAGVTGGDSMRRASTLRGCFGDRLLGRVGGLGGLRGLELDLGAVLELAVADDHDRLAGRERGAVARQDLDFVVAAEALFDLDAPRVALAHDEDQAGL